MNDIKPQTAVQQPGGVGLGRALVALGILGFVSLAAFMADLSSQAGVLIGLVERGVVYSILIGFIGVGVALRR